MIWDGLHCGMIFWPLAGMAIKMYAMMTDWRSTILEYMKEISSPDVQWSRKEPDAVIEDAIGHTRYNSSDHQAIEEINSFAQRTAHNRFHRVDNEIAIDKQAREGQHVRHHIKDKR